MIVCSLLIAVSLSLSLSLYVCVCAHPQLHHVSLLLFTLLCGHVYVSVCSGESKNNEKTLGETQTLRAGCSKAEPEIFAPPQTAPGGAGRPKFNQLETVTTFTYRSSLVKIVARHFELSW